MNNELKVLREVYETGLRLRKSAPVDDDFPEMMHDFDGALRFAKDFINTHCENNLNSLSKTHFNWVEEMGWHNKTVLEALALIASEVGEAVNECRGEQPTKLLGEELADIILRVIDLAEWQGINIENEITRKMEINKENGTRGRRV